MISYVPINSDDHLEKNWIKHGSLAFAKTDTVAPLYVNEIGDALHEMPIAFVKNGDRYELVVVMGLRPNENLFVSEQNIWQSRYIPVVYRSSPFNLLPISNSGQSAFCIDASCVTDNTVGEPFFNEAGEITESVKQAFELVKKLNEHRGLTENLCDVLKDFNLIEPWNLTIQTEDDQLNVNGLYKVSEKNLNTLADADFLALRKSGTLPIAYAQIISSKKVNNLAEILSKKIQLNTQKTHQQKDTFSFEGLL